MTADWLKTIAEIRGWFYDVCARGRRVLCPLTALACHRETITDDKEGGGVCMISDGSEEGWARK